MELSVPPAHLCSTKGNARAILISWIQSQRVSYIKNWI